MNSYWTENIRNRKKQGFGMHVENWFEEESLINLSNELLKNRSQKVFEYIDFDVARKFLDKGQKHWNLLQLALWAHNNESII